MQRAILGGIRRLASAIMPRCLRTCRGITRQTGRLPEAVIALHAGKNLNDALPAGSDPRMAENTDG